MFAFVIYHKPTWM